MTTVWLSDLSRTSSPPMEQSATVASPHGNQSVCACNCVCAWVGGTCLRSYHNTTPSLPSSAALFSLVCPLSKSSLFPVLERPGSYVSECALVVLALWGQIWMLVGTLVGSKDISARTKGMHCSMSMRVLTSIIHITMWVHFGSPLSLNLKQDFATFKRRFNVFLQYKWKTLMRTKVHPRSVQ